MREFATEAFILGLRNFRENDRSVFLYTKDLGRVEVKVIGGRKILSKLSPHLDVLNLVNVRLIEKSKFTLADAITKNRFLAVREDFKKSSAALNLLFLTNFLAPVLMPDLPFWHHLSRAFKSGRIHIGSFLKLLGYDAASAYCESCRRKDVGYFNLEDQSFLCVRCSLKFPENKVIFLG